MAHDRLSYLDERPDVTMHGELLHEYWYRPGELLVHEEDIGRIEDEFEGYEVSELSPERAREVAERASARTGSGPPPVERGFEAAARAGLVRLETSRRMNVPALVEHLRQRPARRPEDREVRVAPHHVLMGVQAYIGSPADEPEPAGEGDWEPQDGGGGDGAVVAVLDTGCAEHPVLAGRVETAAGDAEVVDEDGDGERDHQAGHGTFVAGRVLARAPGARVRAHRVLDSWGVTDELTLADCLARLEGCDVVNLSLGGYSHDNQAPLALTAALEALPARTAVVAAAGNYGKARPFWPAAAKRCIAVAAPDEHGDAAGFTNHGWWVDACSAGTRVVSTFLEHTDPGGERFAGYARWSGTSFAAPFVAAAVADRAAGAPDAREAAFRLLREAPPHPSGRLGVVIR